MSNKPANTETKAEDGEDYKEWHANRLTFAPESSKVLVSLRLFFFPRTQGKLMHEPILSLYRMV